MQRITKIVVKDYWVSDKNLINTLDRISDFSNQESTYYFPPRRIIKDLNSEISWNVDSETNRKLSEILSASDTGAVIFGNGEKGYLIEPPFPIIEDEQYNNYEFHPLRNILNQPRVIGVISLRLGRFAVGVYQGRQLISSKTGSRYVKGRHRAGGSSATRFSRIREKQKTELFDKVCGIVYTQFSNYWDQLEWIFLAGERMTLKGFLDSCERLNTIQSLVASRVLNVREPSRKALETLPQDIWKCHVYEFA